MYPVVRAPRTAPRATAGGCACAARGRPWPWPWRAWPLALAGANRAGARVRLAAAAAGAPLRLVPRGRCRSAGPAPACPWRFSVDGRAAARVAHDREADERPARAPRRRRSWPAAARSGPRRRARCRSAAAAGAARCSGVGTFGPPSWACARPAGARLSARMASTRARRCMGAEVTRKSVAGGARRHTLCAMAKQRQVRIEQKSALAAMSQLEERSDEELLSETKYRAAAQAILGARAAERYDAQTRPRALPQGDRRRPAAGAHAAAAHGRGLAGARRAPARRPQGRRREARPAGAVQPPALRPAPHGAHLAGAGREQAHARPRRPDHPRDGRRAARRSASASPSCCCCRSAAARRSARSASAWSS